MMKMLLPLWIVALAVPSCSNGEVAGDGDKVCDDIPLSDAVFAVGKVSPKTDARRFFSQYGFGEIFSYNEQGDFFVYYREDLNGCSRCDPEIVGKGFDTSSTITKENNLEYQSLFNENNDIININHDIININSKNYDNNYKCYSEEKYNYAQEFNTEMLNIMIEKYGDPGSLE